MTSSAKTQIDFEKLPKYQDRTFVAKDADLTQLSEIKAIYDNLIERPLNSQADLEQWMLDRSEMEAALDQTTSILYIRMTCQTDDQSRADAYKHFVEHITPAIKPLDDQLNNKYLEAIKQYPVDKDRYKIYTDEIQTDVELFVQDNVELQKQVALLSQEYQTVCGSITVEFEGEERTLPQMGKFQLETDRALREKAWRATTQRTLKEKDKLDKIFDQMLVLRHKIAQNAGFDNYMNYKFKDLHRFDYTPQDCKEYHQTVEEIVIPIWKEILEKRKAKMKLDDLRPWDNAVDPEGRAPLKPFEEVDRLSKGCLDIFNKVDSDLGSQFEDMYRIGLLDLASRKGKAPGGYQSTLNESRKPFIFMNAVGVDDDVRTLLHEGGHAFHALACAHDPLLDYRHGPMEFCEVASMSMELLGGEHLDVFYKEEEVKRSKEDHLEGVVHLLVWVATIDAFQHWIYENPDHDSAARKAQWLAIRQRFGSQVVNWDGLEEEHQNIWHRQLHIFEVPFYYIEYGIAQLGALQLWLNSKKDKSKAIADYRQALSLGGAKPLPELFQTAGIKFDFSKNTIAPLMEAVKMELDQL